MSTPVISSLKACLYVKGFISDSKKMKAEAAEVKNMLQV